jgi:hypothetical protein
MSAKTTATSLVVALTLALTLMLAPTSQVHAQQGITWTTGFQIQNLGTATAEDVTIEMYSRDGTLAATIANETIAVDGSKTYFPVPEVDDGFQGSAVISSSQPVAAILNILGNNGVSGQPYYSEAATGVAKGATTVNLPLIQRGNNGFNTWFAVQNAGDATASVTVAFTAGPAGQDYTTDPVSIEPGAAAIFDQIDETNLGDLFVGSAQVTSSQPLAVVVNQVGTGDLNTLFTYSGFASGSNSIALPLVQQANDGFITGISIQNVSAAAAEVTIDYSANLVSGGASLDDDTARLEPGASAVFLKDGADKYVGSAVVTSSGGAVVVVVNQSSAATGTSYEGLNQATGSEVTNRVSLPLLVSENAGFFTGVQCRNVSESPTTITLTYSEFSGFTPPADEEADVPAGGTANFLQNFGQLYVGSGVVTTSPSANVVCIVNQANDGTIAGDAFLTYNGINY